PSQGPFLVLYLRLKGDRIAEAAFQTHGCAPSIAAGSLLCEALPGQRPDEACARWTEPAIHDALGGLPPHKRHCSVLAAAALRQAAEALGPTRKGEP
ncbi:MAG: iron-sulfur cluster assembly scaffold protein, partial [Planctomycetota bacterium]|nr:iron-sulfur cluster assembly scaffold protein [Planctomycetota bacterium]